MPQVGKKTFAYTPKGEMAAKNYAKKTGKKMVKKSNPIPATFAGKSTKLGHGGRAAILKAKGVPQAVIGMIARKKQAAPGMKNYHGK